MSGQYPPPNPAHPYSRVPHPPPWGHPSQPTPGLNMVGSGMSYFGSPHAGLRGTQPWAAPPQSHKPPADARPPASANPLFGLQMLMADNATRIPSEYQQEESMDLSSHPVSKPPATAEPTDSLRNGTVPEVNGEVRTETSVIAANPLRESASDSGVSERVGEETVMKQDIGGYGSVKTTSSIMPAVTNSVINSVKDERECFLPTEVDRIREFIMKVDKPDLELGMYGFDNAPKGADSLNSSRKLDESGVSFLDSSALSVDTDESKLVVAESSAEDIFGISPVGEAATSVLYDDKSKDSKQILSSDTFPRSEVGSALVLTEEKPVVNNATANEPQPQPSVENVEILLESMFNSQEENSCSSQTSCGAPQSVIVSGGRRPNPSADLVSPMKVEDLASTLAEDTPVKRDLASTLAEDTPVKCDLVSTLAEDTPVKHDLASTLAEDTPVKSEVKEEKKDGVTDDVMLEIEKKLEMLTESAPDTTVHERKGETEIEKEAVSEPVVNIPSNKDSEARQEDATGVPGAPAGSKLPTQNAEPGSSNNPFIEVESELEKMFAGIVEPVEEGGSESQTQNTASEPKKDTNKRTVAKRKKANNRRPSDCSVFGGTSSGENTPIRKRGRKRASEVSSDRSGKKIKVDGERKRKVPKDVNSELGAKVRGPFVHIEGPRESPTSVMVVNSGVRPDDEDVQRDKSSARRKHSSVHRAEGVASRKAYNSSTLSARYNSESADLSWVCALCHRGPHCVGGLGGEPAGDLFGPYRVPPAPPMGADDATGAPSDREVMEEQRRRGGKYPKSLRTSGGAEGFVQRVGKKSKRSQSVDSVEGPGMLPVEDGYEVWLHGACAEWAPGLCVVGTSLVGLQEAVWTAVRTRCVCCGEAGAGVGCVVRSCPAAAHLPCARLGGWLLDPHTFIARCHQHRTRLRPS